MVTFDLHHRLDVGRLAARVRRRRWTWGFGVMNQVVVKEAAADGKLFSKQGLLSVLIRNTS